MKKNGPAVSLSSPDETCSVLIVSFDIHKNQWLIWWPVMMHVDSFGVNLALCSFLTSGDASGMIVNGHFSK